MGASVRVRLGQIHVNPWLFARLVVSRAVGVDATRESERVTDADVCAPTGQGHVSPGQRPGYRCDATFDEGGFQTAMRLRTRRLAANRSPSS